MKAKAKPHEAEDQLLRHQGQSMDSLEMCESFQAAHSWAGEGVCTRPGIFKEGSVCTGPHRSCVQLKKNQICRLKML